MYMIDSRNNALVKVKAILLLDLWYMLVWILHLWLDKWCLSKKMCPS